MKAEMRDATERDDGLPGSRRCELRFDDERDRSVTRSSLALMSSSLG